MEPLLGFLKDTLSSQPVMQAFAGGASLLLIAYMVIRATKEKNTPAAAVATNTISDVPQPFLQGPRETIDLMRELRDLGRRAIEDIGRIAECARVTKDESIKQTRLLEAIEREQAVENRMHERGHPER